ncbi:MAG: preprotein translocase subunit YajC [Bacteroidetes bacterium]|nr:preprotein translocase subunit YajC [Bacteroidota bacterium]
MQIILLVGIMVVFYFFMIRPQMQRQKKEKEFRKNLQKGDKIVTLGGIHGRILSIEDNTVLVEVDDSVKMRFEKAAIRERQDAAGSAQK